MWYNIIAEKMNGNNTDADFTFANVIRRINKIDTGTNVCLNPRYSHTEDELLDLERTCMEFMVDDENEVTHAADVYQKSASERSPYYSFSIVRGRQLTIS